MVKAHKLCSRPPKGWYCSKDEGHDGPCPTFKLGVPIVEWSQAVVDKKDLSIWFTTKNFQPGKFHIVDRNTWSVYVVFVINEEWPEWAK